VARRGRARHGIVKTDMEDRGKIELTSLEKKAKELLDSLNVEYIPQYSTRTGYVIDFAVFLKNGKKIDLETDGARWHSSKKSQKRDNFRNYMLRREGWEIVRIREKNFDEDFKKLREILEI
jgi:very-short-patch-repair endonuclease